MSNKNRLTLFIFIALILGVAVGYYLNINTFDKNNESIASADAQVKKIEIQMSNLGFWVFRTFVHLLLHHLAKLLWKCSKIISLVLIR